jgi:hypothetical protein
MQFDAPIPGQSLTTEPKNFAWERPPEIVDPELAIQYHLEKLSRPAAVEGILDTIEVLEVDIANLTKGYLRAQVAEGIHSIDVSLIVAPVVHEFIKQIATSAGIDFDEGFEDKTRTKNAKRKREEESAKRYIKNLGVSPRELVEDAEVEAEEDSVEVPTKGLMSRETM